MTIPSSHTAGYRFQFVIATTMTVIYLLIALSPLSTLAMQSKRVAHSVTGECSGDCNICDCSVESRASHNCCCSIKKQQQKDIANLAVKGFALDGASASPAKQRVKRRDCCAKRTLQHEVVNLVTPQKKERLKTQTVFKCGCPCGNNKVLALWGGFNHEIIPCRFAADIAPPAETRSRMDLTSRLTSRHCEPPDPPPRLSNFF